MNNEELTVKVTEIDSRSKSNSHRLTEVEERLAENEKLTQSVALIAQRQDTIESDVKEIKGDVKSLTAKPGKRWDSIVEKALLVIVAAIIGYVIKQMGF